MIKGYPLMRELIKARRERERATRHAGDSHRDSERLFIQKKKRVIRYVGVSLRERKRLFVKETGINV